MILPQTRTMPNQLNLAESSIPQVSFTQISTGFARASLKKNTNKYKLLSKTTEH